MFRFFLVTGIGLAVINGWIAWWLWRALAGTGWLRVAGCLLTLALGVAFPLLYRGHGTTLAHTWLLRAGAFWMGMAFYVFALAVLADIWCLGARVFTGAFPATPRWGMSKNAFWRLTVRDDFSAGHALRHYEGKCERMARLLG